MLSEGQQNKIIGRLFWGLLLFFVMPSAAVAQKELPQVTIATAVPGWGFAAIWVAEQLQYFEKQRIRAKISIAGGGSPCFSAVVARSVNFCASSSEGLILSRIEGSTCHGRPSSHGKHDRERSHPKGYSRQGEAYEREPIERKTTASEPT